MSSVPAPALDRVPAKLLDRVASTLVDCGHHTLAAELRVARKPLKTKDGDLSSTAAAQILGVSSINTIKNWLEGGHFPSAYRTPGGHWRFVKSEVLAVKEAMENLRRKNEAQDLSVPHVEDDEEPPLL